MDERIKILRKKVGQLPQKPGVYLMRDGGGQIIYVGKAKSLKNRVGSYFTGLDRHTEKTAKLVSKIADFDVIITETEFEALVLECSLIKKHTPKYNILLKDDKGYPLIRVTKNEDYPRMEIVSKRADDGAAYYGPYGLRSIARQAMDTILETLRLPTCTRSFPKDTGKERPCLYFHLGKCIAPCRPGITPEQYRELFSSALMLLEGKYEPLAAKLRKEMDEASEGLYFERAAELRDRLRAVERLGEKQKVISHTGDMDVIAYSAGGGRACIAVLNIVGGIVLGKDFEIFERLVPADAAETLSSFIKQYYSAGGRIPPVVALSHDIEDAGLLSRLLTEAAGKKVTVACPKKGERRRLVSMAAENAAEELLRSTTREERQIKSLNGLAALLGLPEPPGRIEAFDISNTGDTGIVGSMVVFENGKPVKRDYRRFKISSSPGQDDYGSMREVVSRRLAHKEGDEKFPRRPSLMLIDGGSVHAAAAKDEADALGLSDIPIFGMVKDDRHKTRALASPDGREIGFSADPAVFALVGRIQEEAHRFAIEYHRSLRSKKSLGSSLEKIPGVGAARRAELLKRFKSVSAIASAGRDELSEVLPGSVAEAVYAHFHGEPAQKDKK